MHQAELKLLTKRQIADQMSVSIRTIDSWMSRGAIPYVKIGHVVRFSAEDVSRALESFKIKPRKPL